MSDFAAQEVLEFWFTELEPADWWKKSDMLDQQIQSRFGNLHAAANACELYGWRSSAQGRLAEIIVLDQFSRNIYRNTAAAFASDSLALALAQEAITAAANQSLKPVQNSFLYMPFMHSESRIIHEQAVTLYKENGIAANLEFELKHKAIIDKFGRYPHRNDILGRESTEAEKVFLQQPGSSF